MRFHTETGQKPETPFIYDKAAYLGACDLIRKFGPSAGMEALHKADQHESRGERQQSYYWRRVESAIEILLLEKFNGLLN